jgi:DNA-directed RNA polymerase specialized sigma24 family protein
VSVEPLDPTDEALVRSVLSGDRDRFELLVERYQTRLVNYLYRMVRNLEEAHDLTQEVFIRVYQALIATTASTGSRPGFWWPRTPLST